MNDGRARFTIINGTNTVYLYTNVITDGNWHYITVTRNGTSGDSKIYVDGAFKALNNKMFTVDFFSNTAKLEIGCYNNATVLNGSLDEVAIHNVELQLDEIQQHYNNGLNGLGYYETAAPIMAKSAETVSTAFDLPQIELNDLKVYPNPFSDRLRFEFVAQKAVDARIDLYDMTGRMIKTIFEQPVEGGVSYQAEFKPESSVSGMYIYRMIIGDAVYNGKVVFKKE